MTLKKHFFLLIAMWIASTLAAAQQSSPAPAPSPATGSQQQQDNANGDSKNQQIPTVRVRTDEVNVVFTVVDKDGKFVRDLKQDQFRVLDNKLPPRQMMNFAAQTDLPLHVGLLIDASNSIRDRFQFEKDAASEFLYEIVRPKADRAFVLAFDETWDVTQDFTGDIDKLRTGVKVIKAGGGTAMWDSIYFGCRDKLMKEPSTGAVRRAIILISDGEDNLSRVYRDEAIDMAQRAEVIVYTISTSLVERHTKGDDDLRKLADATGGRAFFPVKLDDVVAAFSDIQEELRSQYMISYRPDQFVANGQFRPIQIMTDSKKYKVRAKKGYYVPKQ
ncbi:MAG TPA: VWA domain-containing protein [Candidatus Angelobacter sp.]|nr:VWA domain-containing protein [Candidatus Angelobacter sp.]